MPKLALTLQFETSVEEVPKKSQFRTWAKNSVEVDTEVTIRLVDEEEGRELNNAYRGKDYATNVLTFPLTEDPLMGDIVLCAPVVLKEAAEQGKSAEAHFAHLTVHGLLHLQGYDHETETEADVMEALETEIVTKLGYPAPYAE